jgi:hypothetical protein
MPRILPILLLSSLAAVAGLAIVKSSATPIMRPAPPYVQPPAPTVPAAAQQGNGQGSMIQQWQSMFNAANTTHDGHLTAAQAQAAGLQPVVDHFSEIDLTKRGYITFNDILAWNLDRRARMLEQKAAQLRAMD